MNAAVVAAQPHLPGERRCSRCCRIGVAIYLVNVTRDREAERTLQREIVATGALVDQLRADAHRRRSRMMARLIADVPKLKAAVDTNDPPTVQDIADGYQAQLDAEPAARHQQGRRRCSRGRRDRRAPRRSSPASRRSATRSPAAKASACCRSPTASCRWSPCRSPIERRAPRDPRHAQRRLPARRRARGAAEADHRQRHRVRHGRPDSRGDAAARRASRRCAERLRTSGISRRAARRARNTRRCRGRSPRPPAATARRRSGRADPALAHRAAAVAATRFTPGSRVTAVLAVLLATLLSFAVARTIARPLAAITDVMREVAATGDLTRKIALRHGNRWDDEDARLLATTFNTLTDSIARVPARDVAEGAARRRSAGCRRSSRTRSATR